MSGPAPETSERIVPGRQVSLRQHLLLLRHQFAYAFARARLPAGAGAGARVLEIGCGAGYGAELLAGDRDVVAGYVGLDVDAAAVAHAAAAHAAPHRSFRTYDGERLPFDAARFDAAVSFQVVEHVVDDRRFVAEIRRVLADDGVLVLSTPNRLTRVAPGRRPWNRHHVREYAPDELAALLGGAFAEVALFGVRGSEEIERLEGERLRAIRRLAAIDVLGLRDRIPESLRQTVARWVERGARDGGPDPGVERFGVDDYRCESGDLERALDLLAVCRGAR